MKPRMAVSCSMKGEARRAAMADVHVFDGVGERTDRPIWSNPGSLAERFPEGRLVEAAHAAARCDE